ncbi:MAG: queuosine precursor transporter [Alphaproteobacteria bacterium]|nr:queuosine precursor transporter [Alphaproteobacteria bacterium]MBU0858382.1 queuosine precursor transporter [Alphaproteobacteria bacterium]
MSNEVLFFAVMLLGLLSIPVAVWRGQVWVQGLIVMMMVLLGVTDAKVVLVFGLPITLGTALYVTIFLATDVLTENYGRKVAVDTAKMSVFALVLFQIYLQAIRIADPAADVQSLSDAMDVVFTASLRIVVAGLVVYYISQRLDIALYDWMKRRSGEGQLWLRNNVSTLVSQLFDTFAFAFLAFYGMFDGWLALAAVAYGVKAFVIIVDTPFAYLSRRIARVPQKAL